MVYNQCGLCPQKAKISKKTELLQDDFNATHLQRHEKPYMSTYECVAWPGGTVIGFWRE